jgi:hypothetical protein
MSNLPDIVEFAAVMAILCVPVLILVAGWPLARALGERLSRAPTRELDSDALSALEARLDERLSRLEQHVDTIAIEVERGGEAQRYVAKLLAGRDAASLPPSLRHPSPIPHRTPSGGSRRNSS